MKENSLTQEQIDKLDKIAKECGFEFCLPPFKNSNNPFFVCDVKMNRASELIQSLHKVGLSYRISFEDKKQFVEVIWK